MPSGNVVKVYRDRVDVDEIVADARAIEVSPAERLARAIPFPGTFYFGLPLRNYLPYGSELLDNGLERAAVTAFERAAQAKPGASTLYRLGTLLARSGETARARAAFEHALALKPDLAEANNDLGALLAQSGRSRRGHRPVSRGAGVDPRISGRVEQSWLCASAHRPRSGSPSALRKGAGAAARFSRSAEQSGPARPAAPATWIEAERISVMLWPSPQRLWRGRQQPRARFSRRVGKRTRRSTLLERCFNGRPEYEAAYVTLAKIHFSAGRPKEGIAVLERLLQRNPNHAVALELLRQWKGR